MDTLPGDPGPPQSQNGSISSHALKGEFCQVSANSDAGLQHPSATMHYMFTSHIKSHDHKQLNYVYARALVF